MTASTVIVNDVEPRRQYTATAAQTMFDFPIPFFGVEDVTVWLTPSGQSADDAADLLTITTDYTVTGEGTQDGGLITLVNGAAAGDIVTIERIVAIERLADYQTAGDLLAETLNEEQDTEIFIAQQLRQDIDRSVKRSTSSTSSADLTLPEPEANKFLKWKVDVSGLENGAAETPNDASEVSYSQGGTGSVSRTVEQKLQESVSVKDFGAVGDGVTDDSVAVQAAINFGMPIEIEESYNMNGVDTILPAGTSIVSRTGRGELLNTIIKSEGVFGTAISLTAEANVGDSTLELADVSGINVGDWLRIVSSLNCNSTDAGRAQLGDRNTNMSFFAEYGKVIFINPTTKVVTLEHHTTWRYPITSFTDSGTRTTSVVYPVTPVENLYLEGFSVKGADNSGAYAITMEACFNARLVDLTVTSDYAGAVQDTYGKDNIISGGWYEHTVRNSTDANTIPVKFRSSENCLITDKANVVSGHQGVDCTYIIGSDIGGGPSNNCGAIGIVTRDQTTDGIVSHPGCFASIFKNNFVYARTNVNGIRIRSHNEVVKDNLIISKLSTTHQGILIGEEFTGGSVVSGNKIIGCATGIRQTQVDLESYGGRDFSSKVIIEDNVIADGIIGITIDAAQSSKLLGTIIRNNYVYSDEEVSRLTRGISIGSYSNGVSVYGNTVRRATEAGIRYFVDSVQLSIFDNFVEELDTANAIQGPSTVTAISDVATFPGGNSDAQHYFGRIITDGSETDQFASVPRDYDVYRRSEMFGFQGMNLGAGNVQPPSTRGGVEFYFDMSGSPTVLKALAHDGTSVAAFTIGTF